MGKLQNGEGLYYINKTKNYVKYLVDEVRKHQSLKERNVNKDMLHTSISFITTDETTESEAILQQ